VAPLVDKWINVIRYGALAALFLLVYVLILRPIKSQIVTTFRDLPRQLGATRSAAAALKGGGATGRAMGRDAGTPETEEVIAPELGESLSEVRQAVLVKKSLLEKAKKEPATFSRLIQNWLRQETKV
jgi:flagellar biosynthesis/type III secretory pathway M-ring protein FliF/YscJ